MEEDIDNLNFAEDEEDENQLYDPSNPSAPAKPKKKKKIELSQKQKDKIQQTLVEMRQNRAQVQYTGGRPFDKGGFVSNPSKIEYKDFEIGKKMSITIDIINVSYSFNSFKLLPLDDDIIDFFEIDYRSCGRIPAGISTKMTLHFTPLVNKDYKSYLRLDSETGMCLIPIECYCKKCTISFDKQTIDYGEVILGQEIEKELVVTNKGALKCKYIMVDAEKNVLLKPVEDDETDNEPDLEPSYKDYRDRKIILHKNDFALSNEGIESGIVDKIKQMRVEEYKQSLINEQKEILEAKKKEEEELLAQQAATNTKAKAAPAKVKGKDKEPEVQLINGLPVDIMEEVDKKVEEYANKFTIETEEDKAMYAEEEQKIKHQNMKLHLLKQIVYPTKGKFDGYSDKTLPIILKARFIGTYSLTVFLKIEYKNQTEYKQFSISFSVVDLPIYSEKKTYELNHIIYDTIIREKIILVNNTPSSYKLQIYFHKDLKDYIDLNPNLGYIQANSTFEVWLKLKVDKNVNQLISFFKGQNTYENTEYNFPLKIVLNNVKIPLITIIHFNVTTDKVNISEKMINYGKRFIDEATKVAVSLDNTSALPMKYGFIMLPKEFTAKTNIDVLLSNEKTFVDIIYEPKDDFLGHREGDLFCKVVTSELTCQNIKIKYHIELIKPEIKLEPKKIKFQALPEGEHEEVRIIVSNKNEYKSFDCEFLTPPNCFSGLTIMPKVFVIKPKGFITCVVRYDSAFRDYGPFSYEDVEKEAGIHLEEGLNQVEGWYEEELERKRKELEEMEKQESEAAVETGDKKKKAGNAAKDAAAAKKQAKPVKKDKKQLEEEERKKKEEEEKAQRELEEKKEERLKTFNKAEELKYFGAEHINITDPDKDRSSHWKYMIPLFYKQHTNDEDISIKVNDVSNDIKLKASFIEVHTTTVEKVLVFDKEELNFGEVSIQTRKTLNLVLTNNSNKPAKLKMKPLILTNCFTIVNAVRDIPAHSSFNFIVEFIPLKDVPYSDEFTVYTNETCSTIKLTGVGVQPDVETNVKDGILFLGHSVVYNPIEKSFDIINKSNFKISFVLKTIKSGKKNKTGLRPFCYTPYMGDIEGLGKCTVKVEFNGDHQDFENYFEFVLVDVPNQKVENKILISAFCWDRQVYWKELTDLVYPDGAFMNKLIEQDIFVDCLKMKSNSKSSNNDKVLLVFTPDIEGDDDKENKNGNKPTNDKEKDEKCYKRKLLIGNCKLSDPKSEKNGSYEIIMNKDDPYFTCDNPKGGINAGSEVVINFGFKKPAADPLTQDIECLKGVGTWITSKVELKINGGYIQPGALDAVVVDIYLKAYIEQL